jgi:hypothetical protein
MRSCLFFVSVAVMTSVLVKVDISPINCVTLSTWHMGTGAGKWRGARHGGVLRRNLPWQYDART